MEGGEEEAKEEEKQEEGEEEERGRDRLHCCQQANGPKEDCLVNK